MLCLAWCSVQGLSVHPESSLIPIPTWHSARTADSHSVNYATRRGMDRAPALPWKK